MSLREPRLQSVLIAELRPTQVTVGFKEVQRKRDHFRGLDVNAGDVFLGRHMVPTVLGPKHRHYLIDNHHLVRALSEDKVEGVLVTVVADLSTLAKTSFWTFLDNRAWCHPYDAEGRRVGFDAIPKLVDKLKDDPYRSLAGALRRVGGYAKDTTPFSEFLWADFLRRRLKPKAVEADFDAALDRALVLARSGAASFLPGWCGPDNDS